MAQPQDSRNGRVPGNPGARPRRRPAAAAVVAIAALLVAGLALAVGLGLLGPHDDMEPNVIAGPLPGKSDEQIAAELQQKLDESMIGFSIETEMAFEDGEAEGPISFENPAGNAKLLKLTITRDDTGEAVYRSGFVKPGTYVEKGRLEADLPAGTYPCTALVDAYAENDRRYLGAAAAGVTITVKQ